MRAYLGGELRPIDNVELGEDVRQMGLDGSARDEETVADLRIGQGPGNAATTTRSYRRRR
jgi:hypothetical protein